MRARSAQLRSLAELVAGAERDAVIELPPGRYAGSVELRRGVTLRGAGDLTRIVPGEGAGAGSVLHVRTKERVRLESLLVEGGEAERGGGILVSQGTVWMFNVHLRDCAARDGGGALAVRGGTVEGRRLRFRDVHAPRGGAILVDGAAERVELEDFEVVGGEADFGGAVFVGGRAEVKLRYATIARSRAEKRGQMVYATGREGATLRLDKVRFESPAWEELRAGAELFNDPEGFARVLVEGCDLPRGVRDVPGVVATGRTRWR